MRKVEDAAWALIRDLRAQKRLEDYHSLNLNERELVEVFEAGATWKEEQFVAATSKLMGEAHQRLLIPRCMHEDCCGQPCEEHDGFRACVSSDEQKLTE